MKLLRQLKDFVIYDADREFYAKVFPDSVSTVDLMRLRRMEREDLADVLKIETKNYQYPWSENIFNDCFTAINYTCWICEDDENIIGYAILSVAAGESHIMNISVDPSAQGLGVGKKIMEHLIGVARKKSETMFLEVRPSNVSAIALYTKLGFNEVGVRKNYYPAVGSSREDAVILALELVSLF